MKKFVLLVVIAVVVSGCDIITGSGNIETHTYDVSNFTKIFAKDRFKITITQQPLFDVQITTPR